MRGLIKLAALAAFVVRLLPGTATTNELPAERFS